jgi:crotonobetainyl-CoA:carnitine CoA-transferase CaiB-like acyl-CoA transferase
MHQASNVTTEAGSYSWLVAGQTVQRQTGRHAAVVLTQDTQMRCRDGRWVNTGVAPRAPKEFAAILGWIRDLGLESGFPEAIFLEMGASRDKPITYDLIGVDDEATAIFAAGREALGIIAANVSAAEYFTGFQERGFAVGVIYSPEEAFEDPHFVARGFQVAVEHPDLGRIVRYPGAPYRMSATPWRISRPAPRLGEHDAEVWREVEAR